MITDVRRRWPRGAGVLALALVVLLAAVGCTIRREFIGHRLTAEDMAPLPTLKTKGDVL